tara:strand:- start:1207 stop:1461 length:255 start_codon:yes stop_codon:yes gene_type:complete
MKPQDPIIWLKNKSYINGIQQSQIMRDYTKYYIIEQKTIEHFRDLFVLNSHDKFMNNNKINFETYYNMMGPSVEKYKNQLSEQY